MREKIKHSPTIKTSEKLTKNVSEAERYFTEIKEILKDHDLVGVVSLSQNGFTTVMDKFVRGEPNGHYFYYVPETPRVTIDAIGKVLNGSLVVIDEFAVPEFETISDLSKIIKKKKLKVVLHLRPKDERGNIIPDFLKHGLNASQEYFKFGSRPHDMIAVIEEEVKKYGLPNYLIHNLTDKCVVMGEVMDILWDLTHLTNDKIPTEQKMSDYICDFIFNRVLSKGNYLRQVPQDYLELMIKIGNNASFKHEKLSLQEEVVLGALKDFGLVRVDQDGKIELKNDELLSMAEEAAAV
ncbi:MAG: hypothetical protein HY226_05430 [Candidatus Vogelbacteria bacterium]|nr:hypothetical protein [Candidatus Vogelbacteria bacterium]